MAELNYEKDVRIEESALDVEWINQPTLMLRYTRALAKAEREVARLKEKMKVDKAKLDKDIRTHPSKYKLGDIKITEAVVNSEIITHPATIKQEEELIEAQYEVNMVKGAVDAIKQRKDALQDLVKLHGQQYFAGPSVPRDLSHEVRRKMEGSESNKNINLPQRRNK